MPLNVENEDEKWRHVEAAEKIFFDDMPSIPISEMVASYIEKPYVKGVSVNYLYQINFRWTTIEEEKKPKFSPHGH